MRNSEFCKCKICQDYCDWFGEKVEEKDMPNSWILDNKLFICEDCLEKLRKFLGENK